MLIKRNPLGLLSENAVTAQQHYQQRRQFLLSGLALGTGLMVSQPLLAMPKRRYMDLDKSPYSTDEALTDYDAVTGYNNFYEFGTDKADPARYAVEFPPQNEEWRVVVGGECEKPGNYVLEDLLKSSQLEERIYRLRCVEGWSMVIPWLGYPLADILKQAKPTSRAKYVVFTTLYHPGIMRGQQSNVLNWPYVEGLRIDEAMNPLSFLATGLYGNDLLGQNGAPLRLVVPWKYGYKSIKSIVQIEFVETQTTTSWMLAAPKEYGFYSNVNPNVSHPRWSQAKERRIGELKKRETTLYNGYAQQVAHLYSGMDLVHFH